MQDPNQQRPKPPAKPTREEIDHVLAAMYALDNEQDPAEYRCKLARFIPEDLLKHPEKPLLPDTLREAIDQTSRISPETESKLHALMVVVDGFAIASDIVLDHPDISDRDANMLLQAVEELHMAWRKDGERGQLAIDYQEQT